jgi:hypothetical protein
MAIVRHSSHRWWFALVALTAATLATACASAGEMPGKGGHALARDIAVGVSVTACAVEPAFDKGRIVTPLRPAAQACSGPWVRPHAISHTTNGCPVPRRSDGVEASAASRVGADRMAAGARSDGHSTLRPGRRSRLGIDAEDWEDRIDGDDDTELPVRVWFRDIGRSIHDLILPEWNARVALINSPSAPIPSLQPLRC